MLIARRIVIACLLAILPATLLGCGGGSSEAYKAKLNSLISKLLNAADFEVIPSTVKDPEDFFNTMTKFSDVSAEYDRVAASLSNTEKQHESWRKTTEAMDALREARRYWLQAVKSVGDHNKIGFQSSRVTLLRAIQAAQFELKQNQ